MEGKTSSGSECSARGRQRALWVASALLAASILACVGSESERGSAGAAARREGEAVQRRQPTSTLEWDTVPALEYELFQASIDSEVPRKATYRFLLLQSGTTTALSKTMREVLDSLGRADTALVAARAVLYEYRPTGPRGGKVLPRAWGEWVPPEGWDGASADSRRRFHRSYIYHFDPGWSRSSHGASEAAQGR